MKKLSIIIISIFFYITSSAQNFDISPFYGWQMNGKIRFYQGEVKIDNANLLGGTLDITLTDNFAVRLMYSRTQTHSRFYPYFGFEGDFPPTDSEISNDYLQIGTIEFLDFDQVEPYVLTTLGAARFNGNDPEGNDSRWVFAATAGLGLKYFITENIGIKIEGALMLPLYFNGINYYFGFGGGSGLRLDNRAILIQGNFNGGLVIRLAP